MTDLNLSSPTTLRISARKFSIVPEERDNIDYSLLLKQRDNRVTICMVDSFSIKEKFYFSVDYLNQLLSSYSELILFDIIEFLYRHHSFIHEDIFMEKILVLLNKYPIEFIMNKLNNMDILELYEIFIKDNALKFETYIL